eukprot:g6489.t1
MKSVAVIVVLCVLGVYTASADSASKNAESCLSIGTSILLACDAELKAAEQFFGIQLNDLDSLQQVDITASQISEYVSLLGELEVSGSCCEAMCNFQNEFCGCNETLMSLAEGFISDTSIVNTVMEAISQNCRKMPVYFGDTCPDQKEAALIKPTDCAQFVKSE